MASAQAVYIKSGDQPRQFAWGSQQSPSYSVAAAQSSLPLYKESVCSTFQAIAVGTGAVTATVTLRVTNDDNTGRGFVPQGANAPSWPVTTANASTTLTANGQQFTQALVGATISAPGVPIGTTVSSIAAGGAALTMSAAATASSNVQCGFFANNWCATALGVITISGTGGGTDGFTTSAPWRYVQAIVSGLANVTGVQVLMGV